MKIVKFEGATMRDAIAKVKADLGDQAVIVSTRQVRKGLLGTAIEISAAIDDGSDEDNQPRGRAQTMSGPSYGSPRTSGPANEEEFEKALAPLRSELRSLRALVRAAGDSKGTNDLKSEIGALRKLVEDMRIPAPPAAAPRRAPTAPVVSHDSPLTASSTARIVMVVGPTGAGKTTTIAKIAARAALIEERRTALVTLDNYRVGGFEQIKTFADLIGVPVRTADVDAQSIGDAIDDNDELTLIDTAGRSPRDAAAIAELANAISGTHSEIEVHLVIPAATPAAIIDELVLRYRPLGPARILFTKVDEIDVAPELSRAPARLGLPITWITTGQAVPEDLEEPTSARILELASTGLAPTTRNRTRAA
jgi:flagellar biosynthesis protein FlhF